MLRRFLHRPLRSLPLLLALCCAAAGAGRPAATEPAVVGRTVDTSGRPLAAVTIIAVGPRGSAPEAQRPPTTLSAADGRFGVAGLTAGEGWLLLLTAPDHAARVVDLPVLPELLPVDLAEVTLSPGRAVEGRVVDATGAAVRGASVRLLPRGREVPSDLVERAGLAARTDEQGVFRLERVASGDHDLLVVADGAPPLGRPGLGIDPTGDSLPERAADPSSDPSSEPSPDPTPLGVLRLGAATELRGRIVDAEGRPLAGTEVELTSASSDPLFLSRSGDVPGRRVRSDTDGRFALAGLRPGDELHLRFARPGFRADFRTYRLPRGGSPGELGEVRLEPSAEVSGRVVDDRGEPVASATVALVAEGTAERLPSRRAETDETGAFRLEAPVDRELALSVHAFGLASRTLREIRAAADDLEIRLESVLSGRLQVEVLAADGAPAEGLELRLDGTLSVGPLAFDRRVVPADGRVSWPRVPVGDYELRAVGTRSKTLAREQLTVSAGGEEISLRIPEPAATTRLAGRLLDAEGAPARLAEIWFHRTDARSGSAFALTGGRGEWRVDLEPGIYSARVAVAGSPPLELEGLRVGEAPGPPLQWRLEPGVRLTGHLRGLSDPELARASVQAERLHQHVPGVVQADGGFRIEGLTPGSWSLTADVAGSGRHAAATVTVPAEGVDLAFAPSLALAGRVTDRGAPLAGAHVWVSAAGGRPHGASTRTDDYGRFELVDLTAGTYDLRVSGGSGRLHRRRVELPADGDLEIVLASGRVSGRVVRADDGAPLPGVGVRFSPIDHETPDPDGTITIVSHEHFNGGAADGDGSFDFGPLEAGRWRIQVDEPGFVPLEVETVTGDGRDAVDLELELTPTPGLLLDISTESGGQPPRSLRAYLRDPAGCTVARTALEPGASGTFHWSQAPPGEWTLLVESPLVGSRSRQRVRIPGPAASVVLPSVGALQLTVTDLVAAPAPATLRILDAGGDPVTAMDRERRMRERFPAEDGRFRAWSVPPGVYQLRVEAEDGRLWSDWVPIDADRPTEARLD